MYWAVPPRDLGMGSEQPYRCVDASSEPSETPAGSSGIAAAGGGELSTLMGAGQAPGSDGVEVANAEPEGDRTLFLQGARDVGDEDADDMADLLTQVDSLLKPVSVTMILVVLLVSSLRTSPVASGAFQNIMVYEEREQDSRQTKLKGSLENALVFVALIAVVTTVLFLLYKFRCTKLIYAWLISSVGMLLASFGGLVA